MVFNKYQRVFNLKIKNCNVPTKTNFVFPGGEPGL